MKREKGFISEDTMVILLKNLREYKVPHVQLAFGGEPFLHPKLLDYIKGFKRLEIKVEIFTNGLLVNKDMSDKIIDLELDILNFSIDSTNDKTYKEIRQGGNLHQVFENLKYLNELKERLKVKKPFIKLYVTRMADNKLEIKNNLFKEKYGKYVDYIYYNCENNWIGSVDDQIIIGKRGIKNYGRVCVYPWVMMVIAYDGRVVPCPCDFDISYQIGNINKESLQQIWNGARLRYLRRALINKDYKDIKMCEECLWRKYNSPFRLLSNRIRSEFANIFC